MTLDEAGALWAQQQLGLGPVQVSGQHGFLLHHHDWGTRAHGSCGVAGAARLGLKGA